MSTSTEIKVKNLASLELESHPDVVHQVIELLDELKEQYEFKEDVFGSLIVAVSEAINNSVVHGNKLDPAKKVNVDIELRNHYQLVIRVKDEGPGFDKDNLPDPLHPDNLLKPNGRGVYYMKTMAEDVVFNETGNEVELYFHV